MRDQFSSNSDALMFGDGQRFEMAQSGVNKVRRNIKRKTEKRSFSSHPREKSLQLSRIVTPGLILAAGLFLFSVSVFNMVKLTLFFDPEVQNSIRSSELVTIYFVYFIVSIAILFVFYKFWIAPDIGFKIRSWKKRRAA